MVSVTKVTAAAAAAFTLLYFTKLESDDVLAALLCLALAHRARLTVGFMQKASTGILGFDEVEHGNTGRQGAKHRANEWRNREV